MDLNTVTEIVRPRRHTELPAWQAGDAWLAGGDADIAATAGLIVFANAFLGLGKVLAKRILPELGNRCINAPRSSTDRIGRPPNRKLFPFFFATET